MFQRLSLGTKIGGGFALVMLGAIALGITGIIALGSILRTQADNGRIIEIRRTMYDARLAATRYLNRYDDPEAEACLAHIAKVRELGKAVIPALTPDEATIMERLLTLVDDYQQHLQEVRKFVAQARTQAGSAIIDIPGIDPKVKEWRAAGVEVVNQMGAATKPIADRMERVGGTAMTTMVALLILVTISGSLLAWRITRAITRPVIAVRQTLGALATGDLTKQTAVSSQDEVGAMAGDLNRTVDGLRSMVGTITHGAHGIASAAEELNAVSAQLTTSATTVSSQSTSVATSATEVSQNISTFASGVEEMNASVGEISKNASQAASVAQEGVDASARAQKAMVSLEKSSSEIGEIVKLIAGIAEQTNLLALNATIEAARAGDAGRGFAVVAGEVKDLARKTAEATSDIRNRVGGIQNDTHEATAAIKQLSDISDRVSALQQSIASAVEEQSATTRELSGNIAQVSQGGADIAKNIVTVAEAAKAASAGASETLTSAKELSRLAAELQQVIQRFTI